MSENNEDVRVRQIDQENICNFSILAEQLKETKDEVKELEKEKAYLNDVEDEVMLTDLLRAGEGMFFRWGDVFVELEDERFEEVVQREKKRVNTRLEELNKQLDEIKDKLLSLKAELYGRFRDQIALEFD
jgi:prefoldin subunit 4